MDATPNKIVIVPDPILCVNVITKKPLQREVEPPVTEGEGENLRVITPAKFEDDFPWSLYRALTIFVAQRADWQRPLTRTLRLAAFLQKLDEAEPGDKIELRGDLWCDLRDTLQGEDFEIPYPYNIQLPPLFTAILGARDVPEQETLKEVG